MILSLVLRNYPFSYIYGLKELLKVSETVYVGACVHVLSFTSCIVVSNHVYPLPIVQSLIVMRL